MDDACNLCGQPSATGKHRISGEDAEAYPQVFCPRCSSLGVVRCVTATEYYCQCPCSVRWSEPISLP